MLVALSGSQGSGKSTIINELSKQGFGAVERKTSRSILSDWGVTLQEVNNNHELTIKFQDEILRRKWEDERAAVTTSKLFFTERTYADLFVYSLVALGKDNQYSDWLNDYYFRCLEKQQTYDYVYYLTAGHFTVEHDGVRGSNHHYSKMVDLVMKDYTTKMVHPSKLNIIAVSDLEERVQTIKNQMTVELISRQRIAMNGIFPIL